MKKIVKILDTGNLTHDVLQITVEKPEGLSFVPGQATEVSINKEGWREKQRPFSFTSLPGDNRLEFTIKTYPSRNGVTAQLLHMKPGDELILEDVFGTIRYRGEGIFIAGGAGITPFIPIFRDLEKSGRTGDNRLIFANRTSADIIHKEYFEKLLGKHFINILSEESTGEYASGFISEDFLRKYIDLNESNIYLCGPPRMIKLVEKHLYSIGFGEETIIMEMF